jgi:hypothetical protein
VSAAAGLPNWVIRRSDTQAAKERRDAVPVRNRFDSAELTHFFSTCAILVMVMFGRACLLAYWKLYSSASPGSFEKGDLGGRGWRRGKETNFRMACNIPESTEIFTRCGIISEIIKDWQVSRTADRVNVQAGVFPCGRFQYLPLHASIISTSIEQEILVSNRYPYTPCHTAKNQPMPNN